MGGGWIHWPVEINWKAAGEEFGLECRTNPLAFDYFSCPFVLFVAGDSVLTGVTCLRECLFRFPAQGVATPPPPPPPPPPGFKVNAQPRPHSIITSFNSLNF